MPFPSGWYHILLVSFGGNKLITELADRLFILFIKFTISGGNIKVILPLSSTIALLDNLEDFFNRFKRFLSGLSLNKPENIILLSFILSWKLKLVFFVNPSNISSGILKYSFNFSFVTRISPVCNI